MLSYQRTQLAQCVPSSTRDNNFTDLLFSSQNDFLSYILVNAPFSTSDRNTISFEFLFSPIFVPGMVDSVRPHNPPKLYFPKIYSACWSVW